MSENIFTYARFNRGRIEGNQPWRSKHLVVQQPWVEFCQAFAKPSDDLPENGDALGKGRGIWTPYFYADARKGAALCTALILDIGDFEHGEIATALRSAPLWIPYPFVIHSQGESAIRLILPLEKPVNHGRITETRRRILKSWLQKAFIASWVDSSCTSDIAVFDYPAWRERPDLEKGIYACAFRAEGTFPTLEALVTIAEKRAW